MSSYGSCASHYSMEMFANGNFTLLKFYAYRFFFLRKTVMETQLMFRKNKTLSANLCSHFFFISSGGVDESVGHCLWIKSPKKSHK